MRMFALKKKSSVSGTPDQYVAALGAEGSFNGFSSLLEEALLFVSISFVLDALVARVVWTTEQTSPHGLWTNDRFDIVAVEEATALQEVAL